MSQLAPGRTSDIAMLLNKRDNAVKYSALYYKAQNKIDDLAEEGKCSIVVGLRYRLVGASRANDDIEIEKVSRLIEDHVRHNHPKRFFRAWAKG